ncbi:DUF4429 domain-containing protein [Streptomyces sp. NPDC056670]|uniref:DUF4429 domain-containing protein n=1 Tax=Streptomyces sp. NPDC056670 TaxID=3345904 RepID=UPI0036A2F617
MIEVESVSGTVTFDGNAVTIHRGSSRIARSVFGNVTHTLLLSQITAVQWRPASRFKAGHLLFVVPGSRAGALPTPVNRNENAVLFGRREEPAFEKLRDLVKDALTQ